MAKPKPAPQQEEQSIQPAELEKKLRKRERRLQDRLQEAQVAHARALERLKQAEARVRKRSSRIQRVEGRLALIRQQLDSLPPSMPAATSSSEQPQTEGVPHTEEAPPEQGMLNAEPQTEIPNPEQYIQQEQELLAEELRVGAIAPSADPIPVSTAEAPEETAYATQSDQDSQDQEGAARVEPSTTKAAGVPSQPPADPTGFARLARAFAETAERAARVAMERALDVATRLEQMSVGRHLEQERLQAESEAERTSIAAQDAERAGQEAESQAQEEPQESQLVIQSGEILQESLALPQTEEETQAHQVIIQDEEMPQASQLAVLGVGVPQEEQPLLEMEEVPQADSLAIPLEEEQENQPLQAKEMPQEGQLAPAEEITEGRPLSAGEVSQEIQPAEGAPQIDQLTTPAEEEEETPVPPEDAHIREIEEEEEVVSAVASMMIADVAAAAAAEAEALAEASSARTREARYVASQADQVLEEVRAAISSDALSGEDAENYLRDAERHATRSHAVLADAEAAEEQARRAAMNAEAEAEVAEGMAFASSDIAEATLEEAASPVPAASSSSSASMQENIEPSDPADENDGSQITAKLPVIHSQETD